MNLAHNRSTTFPGTARLLTLLALAAVVSMCAVLRAEGPTAAAAPPKTTDRESAGSEIATPVKRTRAEVEALIDELGKTPPDWWESTQLRYPKTLDLTRWDAPPNSKWDQNRTIGQFFWSTINENPSRWKEGCRFAHFLMTTFKDDKPTLATVMNEAAHIYGTLLGDYARAAFWYRKAAGIAPLGYHENIRLAECYWKLGCKPMALEALNRMSSISGSTIKLLGDMGELPRALAIAKRIAADYPDEAYLAAGDACRFNGKYKEALDYYQRVVSLPTLTEQRGGDHRIRCQKMAAASAEAVRLFDTLDLRKIPDGKYVAEGLGYAGMVKVEVTVRSGRIEAVAVIEHKEKQFFTALEDAPRQIIAKQSVKGIDMTTSATITARAIVDATAKALGSAMK